MQQDSEAFNLEQVLDVLRRRLLLVVLCFVVAAGAAFGFSKLQTNKYTATASLLFSNNSLSQQIAGLSSSATSSSVLAQQANNLELVKLGNMATKTASRLGHGLTEGTVSESLSVSGQGESGVVNVSATTTSPAFAVAIADTYARQFVEEQRSANRQYFKSALALVHKQLAALTPAQRVGPDGLQLQDRLQTLSLLSELNYGNVQVAQEALTPTRPSTPKTSRNTLIGGVLGLLIGLGLAFLLERLDRRIKGPEDLEAIYRLPLLGAIPESAAFARPARDKMGIRLVLPPAEAEAFSLIRAHLRFFNVDHDLRTVIIASAAPDDGKTTIARHLAEAAARMGSHVLLLEVDLRHPTLAQQLDIQTGPGLAEVLTGEIPIGEAIQSVDLESAPGEGAKGRTFDVLAAGATSPPNPGELTESHAMETVLDQVRSIYDLVVIDTPPLTAVSDAFPLLDKVDGVVIVGWVGRSRRDAAERLHRVLASSTASLLGVVANGSKSGDPGPYAYPKDGNSSPATTSANSVEFVPTSSS